MAITYEIDAERGLIRTSASGVLTDEELVEHKRALIGDRDFVPGLRELSDVRAVEDLQVTADGIRRMAELDRLHAAKLGDYRLALVVPSDLMFGMARMYQSVAEEHIQHIGVFRTIEEAAVWLEVDERA